MIYPRVQIIKSDDKPLAYQVIGVVGCGLMGAGIAQLSAQSGYRTFVREVDKETVRKGLSRIEGSLASGVERGKLSSATKEATMSNLIGTTSLEKMAECDLVIEAIVEDLTAKQEVFSALEAIVRPETVFASNTSSLCITEMASGTSRPDRFIGLHFFSPVPVMKLVEVIRGLATSDETYKQIFAFGETLGKEPVTAPDRPGFIANRLLIPYLLDAVRAYECGVGTIEDIDKTMSLGCGHPMGPFTLLDFIGIDTTYYIANIMYDEFRTSNYAPPPLLKRMVLAGRLGRKSGHGFYEY